MLCHSQIWPEVNSFDKGDCFKKYFLSATKFIFVPHCKGKPTLTLTLRCQCTRNCSCGAASLKTNATACSCWRLAQWVAALTAVWEASWTGPSWAVIQLPYKYNYQQIQDTKARHKTDTSTNIAIYNTEAETYWNMYVKIQIYTDEN